MQDTNNVLEGVGLSSARKKSRIPAKLDFFQSATGLILALFMWGHMIFVSTILLGKDAMYTVTKMFEGAYIFDEPHPGIVSFGAAVIFIIFIVHAAIALRKFPNSYKQYKTFKDHAAMMNHQDTNLWGVQVITGFVMFFLGSVHLYIIMTNPDQIGPYASSDRVISEWMWPLYLLLLLAVEWHGSIGLYRLAVKWGWFEGKNAKESRAKLKKAKIYVTAFFLTLGILSLAAYMKIGLEHKNNVGERYVPSSQLQQGAH